jgi:hypothetical protein
VSLYFPPKSKLWERAQLDNLYTTALHQTCDILVEEYLHCSVFAETQSNRSGAAIYLADDCYACLLSRVCQLGWKGKTKRHKKAPAPPHRTLPLRNSFDYWVLSPTLVVVPTATCTSEEQHNSEKRKDSAKKQTTSPIHQVQRMRKPRPRLRILENHYEIVVASAGAATPDPDVEIRMTRRVLRPHPDGHEHVFST